VLFGVQGDPDFPVARLHGDAQRRAAVLRARQMALLFNRRRRETRARQVGSESFDGYREANNIRTACPELGINAGSRSIYDSGRAPRPNMGVRVVHADARPWFVVTDLYGRHSIDGRV